MSESNLSSVPRVRPWVFCVLFLASAAVYLHTMNPSVSVGDSGEFIAASQILGLPHAPSYPLYCLLGKAAIVLNPFAAPAYRVNFLSVLIGAGIVSLFLSLALRTGLSPAAALPATLLLLFSNVLWDQSVVSEVFGLNALFALLLAWVWTWPGAPWGRRLCLSAFLFGLGLGDHQTLVLVLPAFGILAVREWMEHDAPVVQKARELLLALAFFAAGFSVYAYLPVRSFRNPALDWSNPETLHNFWRVITRADYGSLSLSLGEKLPRNLASAVGQVRRYWDFMRSDWGIGAAVGLIGWVFWFLRDRWTAAAFFAWFAAAGPGFLVLGNMPFDAQSSGILPRFYLLPALALALAAGHAFEALQRVRRGLAWIALVLPLSLLIWGRGYRDFSRFDFAADDYGRNLLRTLPPGAALFMDGGDDTFYTTAYLTLAEGRRPDLELHDRGGLIFPNPYGDDFRMIPKPQKEERRHQVEGALLGVRPLFYATFDRKVLPGASLEPRGLLYEAKPPSVIGKPPAFDPLWAVYSYRGVYDVRQDRPYRLRALLPVYPYLRGVEDWDWTFLRRAAGFGTDIPWLKGNLSWVAELRGYGLTQAGRLDEAEAAYRFLLEVDPKSASACADLGVLAERRGRLEEAEEWYRRAVAVDPSRAESYYNLGALYWKESRWADVVQMFEKTLALKPDHPQAARYLAVARMRMLQGKNK